MVAAEPFTVVEYDGLVIAWADDWPGLVASAPSLDALDPALAVALAEHSAWLHGHGEDGPRGGSWRMSERIDARHGEPTEGDPCYAADLAPLALGDFERLLRHVKHSQADLRFACGLPDLLLDWIPPGLTAERPDPWAPDVRTVRGILTHALQLEVFYREGLRDTRGAGILETVRPAEQEHAATVAALAGAAASGLDRRYRPLRVLARGREPEPAGEWTLRKAFRRLISHNRAHCAEITQRRVWALLGHPAPPS